MVPITKGLEGERRASRLEGRWLTLLALNGSLLAAAAIYLLYAPRVWESSFQVKVAAPQAKVTTNVNEPGAANITDNAAAPPGGDLLDPAQVQKEILLSNSVLRETAKRLDLSPKEVARMLQARPGYKTGILQVEVRASSAEEAQHHARVLLTTYLERTTRLDQDQVSSQKQALKLALDNSGQELGQAEVNLAQVRTKTGLIDDLEHLQKLTNLKLELEQQRVLALSQLKAMTAQTESLQRNLEATPAAAVLDLRLSTYTPYRTAQTDLDQVERLLAQNRAKYTDTNPKVAVLLAQRKELAQLVRQREQEVLQGGPALAYENTGTGAFTGLLSQLVLNQAQAKGYNAQIRSIAGELAQLDAKIRAVPAAQQKVSEARRRYTIAQGVFNNILAQYQSLQLSELGFSPKVQVLDPPTLPDEPSSPKTLVVLAGALAVGAFSSVALLMWQSRRKGGLGMDNHLLGRAGAEV
ncbi:GumC family protein [Anthocerotibacter panamensis]|uniref:GumC family protein n=1 Tax=Anthocerotibacter panamensis TaxID=2857077 RepID=UPI001C402149|nr:GNVR domain-containing protein [Anthocerotibacter panamensis]